MDAQNWRRVRALFDELADTPPAQWHDRLHALAPGEDALHADVLALLAADRGRQLETDLAAQAPDLLDDLAGRPAQADLTGRRVGPFRLLREIGRGGMGTVWLAERADGQFAQQVAIKLIRSGWDAADGHTRFRAERQILAGLTHPNIARLIDGGVDGEDRPWLALEYVDGVDLRTYCDRAGLGIAARLRLFLIVCAAVAHAHARLIVHRDLKPSNLLVTPAGEVKLLDFGIAKLVDAGDAGVSAARVFTPEYAAPEQVRGEPVTTAVDVHALGLLLYELLTGRRPYRLERSTPAAYERAILDQEPARPSQAVLQADGASEAPVSRRLHRALRGDLDAIVLKALRKDPAHRYASVAEFAADLERYLAGRPVTARRGDWRYRTGRFLRRHALAAGLAAAAVLALSAGLAVALWQAAEARAQRDLARSESGKAEQTIQFLLDIFRSADPALTRGRKVTAEELLQRGVERIDRQRLDDAAMRYGLLVAMGEAYLGIGDLGRAYPLFERALAVQREALPADTLKRVRALVLMGRSRGGGDDLALAGRHLDEAAALLPAEAADGELAADLLVSRGINRLALGDAAGAIDDMARGVALFGATRGPGDSQTASAAITLSWAYDEQDRVADARAVLTPVVAALRAAPEDNPARLADALDALANTYTAASEAGEAVALRREALAITRRLYGDAHGYVQIRLNNLAFSLLRAHDYAGANAAMKESLAGVQATEPPGSRKLGATLNNLATTEYALGHWAEAERLWDAALAIRRAGGDPTDVAFSLTGSAGAAREQGRLGDAKARVDEALGLLRAHASPKPSHLARTLTERAEVEFALGPSDCALAEEAVAVLARAETAADDPQRLHAEAVAAGCLWRRDGGAAARDRAQAAQAALRRTFPADAARLRQAARYAVTDTR
ncbi:MAG TPA: serine/threonine-protein kinase [Dokdonella sp.]|uniref:serine/threonine-protein kinase n=1 Tax=Dokdonella sp. TaxID=2291710 RepID=UPI002CE481B3|nr:serine/threonine-protein kinase [Dokdonella sp.]HUD41245.1 serine/threonine-protein kinase [Dokdonella sp.]